jgi:SNF2 family DNA or RNA helicase
MGLGKTVSTLTAIKQMMDSWEISKTLVVAPLRVARKTWTDEIQEWAHLKGLTTAKLIGTSPEARLAGLRGSAMDADIHLINRENLQWLSFLFMQYKKYKGGKSGRWVWTRKWPWDHIVLDESSSFRNAQSHRWNAAARLRSATPRITELTGTPAPNGIEGLWAQIHLLDRGERLGHNITAFRQRWMTPPTKYSTSNKWTAKPGAEKQIMRALSDIVLSLRAEDYLELEPLIHNRIRVEMSPAELKKYREFQRKYAMELKGKKITAANAGALWGKLLQLANGAIYTDHPAWVAFHDRKLEALVELLDSLYDRQVLIVYSFKSDIPRIREALQKAKITSVRELKTEKDEDDWNANKFRVCILHPASAGHGLNMHKGGAKEIIMFGTTADLELYQQVIARLGGGHRRVGRTVRIHHILTSDTIDMEVLDDREDKEGLQDRLINYVKKIVREL